MYNVAEVEELFRANVREVMRATEEPLLRTIDALKEDLGKLEGELESGIRKQHELLAKIKQLEKGEKDESEFESDESESDVDGDGEPFCAVCGGETGCDSDTEDVGSCAAAEGEEYRCYGDCGAWAHLACIEREPAMYTKCGRRYASGWILNGPGIWCPGCMPVS